MDYKQKYDELYGLVIEKAPWLVKTLYRDHGKYLRIAADNIFGVSHYDDPESWSTNFVRSFYGHHDLFERMVKNYRNGDYFQDIIDIFIKNLQIYIRKNVLLALVQSRTSFNGYRIFRKCIFYGSSVLNMGLATRSL